MAVDTARFTNEELKTVLRLVADCIAITRDVTVEWRITAYEISEIRLDGLAVIDQNAVNNLFVARAGLFQFAVSVYGEPVAGNRL